jgi:hypothetical protein
VKKRKEARKQGSSEAEAEARKQGSSEAEAEARKQGSSEAEATKTRRLELVFDEDVFVRLKNDVGMKLAMASFYGMQDELVLSIVQFMDKGEKMLSLKLKNPQKPQKIKKSKKRAR